MRAVHIHQARVYLAQARHFRHHPTFHAQLMMWAAKRRRQASDAATQGRLFA